MILLVDDEPAVLSFASMVLLAQGFRVVQASNSREAIGLTLNQPVRLLITDIELPEVSGPELANQLNHLQVIYMTGGGNAALARHGLVRDKILLLEKPFSAVALTEVVSRSSLGDSLTRCK